MGFKSDSEPDPGFSPEPGAKSDAVARPRRQRADARRNRDRLVEIAAAAFAEHGVDASLEDIARRARVGIGTLYRHFPRREHLVEIVYRREVEALCAAADTLSGQYPPDEALEQWMQRFVDYIATKRGLASSLRILTSTNSSLFSDTSGKVKLALQGLVGRAIAAGSIRGDIDSSDIMHALSGIYSAPESTEWRDRSRRLISVLMDGLRAGAEGAR